MVKKIANKIVDDENVVGMKFTSELENLRVDYNNINSNGSYYLWDIDNFYNYKLEDLNKKVPAHYGILNTFIKLLKGNELIIEGDLDNYNLYKNNADFSLEEVVEQIAYDLATFNGLAIKLNYTRKKDYAYLQPVEFGGCRRSINYDLETLKNNFFYYSIDWRHYYLETPQYKYPSYRKGLPEDRFEIFWYGERCASKPYVYPEPYYISALSSLITFSDLMDLQETFLKNGMFPQSIYNISGLDNKPLKDETTKEIAKLFKNKKGVEKAGQTILAMNFKVEVQNVESAVSNESLKESEDYLVRNIQYAHSIPSASISGISPGGLGNNAQEINDAHRVFDLKMVKDKRIKMVDTINKLLAENGWLFTIKIKEFDVAELPNTETTNATGNISVNKDITTMTRKEFSNRLKYESDYVKGRISEIELRSTLSNFGMTQELIDSKILELNEQKLKLEEEQNNG